MFTPVGTFSVSGFTTPIPYPFGRERTGYLVTDMARAIQSAKANEADVVVAPFNDPIGRDAIVQWPGGVYMQLYWHTTAPNYTKLDRIPENRVYVSPGRADAFVRAFVGFSQGKIVSECARRRGGPAKGYLPPSADRLHIPLSQASRTGPLTAPPSPLAIGSNGCGTRAHREHHLTEQRLIAKH